MKRADDLETCIEPCGCFVYGAVRFCRMHAAAPDLVKALEAIYECGSIKEAERIAEAALLKGKGK